MDCLVSPPQPGDESYDTFIKVSVRLQSIVYLNFIVFKNFMYFTCSHSTPACICLKSQVGVCNFRINIVVTCNGVRD